MKIAFVYLLKHGFSYHDTFLDGFALNDVDNSRHYIKLVLEYNRVDHFKRVREELTADLIIISGENSPNYVCRSNRKLLKTRPDIKFFKIQGARHFLVEERPDLLADIFFRNVQVTS